ncbi:MAG TPA: VWA domain-containing protein [Thermoanaerobaculia bacterium]|nr:VWA domain-containing protein [Thermoanaerobaculia bacterium]
MSTRPLDRARIATLFLAVLALLVTPAGAQEIRAHEEITVERILIDVHVIDLKGNPIEELRPSDFRVRIDGLPAVVESIEWIDSTSPDEGLLVMEEGEDVEPARPAGGRLIVIFFQTDFQRDRVKGQMRMTTHAIEFLDSLTPRDRVAVVSFDSHLKLRQDFTSDRARLEKAIRDAILINHPPSSEIVPNPSLFRRLPRDDARRAATPEKALYLVGNALLPIEGPKTLVLFGWGLGRYGVGGVQMIRDYSIARSALEASRTSVFSLDISDADYHSLEVGLQKVSADTGGFYARTHIFPRFAIEKLQRAISGHYVLVIKRPDGPRGVHRIEIDLRRNIKATVLSRSTYRD